MDGFTVPREKARLSRSGGRCPDDATLLEFDPFSPRNHRCPKCGRTYEGEAHYLWWVMSYQLWLAERAVHAALLRLVRGDIAAGELAEGILDTYADSYIGYPNRDNVLGPTRLFFSTYLESIWLLQICVAIDLLETAGGQATRGGRVRERIIEPSSSLIRSYDEGASNRQVWNNAALLASSALLGSFPAAEAIVWGRSGIISHLAQGLLGDGTWYEGENYHLFAHRGLWYGVQMAERLDLGLTEPFVAPFIARFDAGFPASFITALPDLTLPSRRDSQYAISVRQWRFAELCELGLLRSDDPRVRGMLARLYTPDIPRAEVGRAQSTAEVERNLPPSALTRADLGWRSLLLARADLPAAEPDRARSVLLDGQGLAILRRDGGTAYVALDYGHSGGGHGHPDRLNLQLAHGAVRWLDDMGTGSYVDPTLHWYRSTLAHNAPLVDGHSQARVHGRLLAYDDDGDAGWVDAEVTGIAPGVIVQRTVVAMTGYLVDVVRWRAPREVVFDLPIHLDADAEWPEAPRWVAARLTGGDGLEDGFSFASGTMVAAAGPSDVLRLGATQEGREVSSWSAADGDHECWRATAPGAPGRPPARFHLLRSRGAQGVVRTVIDWSSSLRTVRFEADGIIAECNDGSIHAHSRGDGRWQIDISGLGARRTIALDGARAAVDPEPPRPLPRAPREPRRHQHAVPVMPDGTPPASAAAADKRGIVLAMGEQHYRRSEQPWTDAGQPSATVHLVASGSLLHITVVVRKMSQVRFAPVRATNDLDNEHPDINSDGLQIHLAEAAADAPVLTWLLVPVVGDSTVRINGPASGLPLEAAWAALPDGYAIRSTIALTPTMTRNGFDLDVIVNEISPDRERRRGQLVLSGGGDWIFLQGNRQSRDRLLHFVLRRA
jgi:hypothetical protein